MGMQENPYPLRLKSDIMRKLKYLAEEHRRSVNKEIEYLVVKEIEKYEKENGEIELTDENLYL